MRRAGSEAGGHLPWRGALLPLFLLSGPPRWRAQTAPGDERNARQIATRRHCLTIIGKVHTCATRFVIHIIAAVTDDSNSRDIPLKSLQERVDDLANDFLSRGVRPTAKLMAARVEAPHHRLIVALEDWARRLGHTGPASSPATPRGGIDFIRGVPRERRHDSVSKAAQAAGQEAARQKADAQHVTRQNDLAVEIERAQVRLEKLEARHRAGERTPHMLDELEKTQVRLQKMREAFTADASAASGPGSSTRVAAE